MIPSSGIGPGKGLRRGQSASEPGTRRAGAQQARNAAGRRHSGPESAQGPDARRTGSAMDTNDSPVASVDRALRILTVVGSVSRGLSLDDLAGRLDIPKSSLHRILAALKYR